MHGAYTSAEEVPGWLEALRSADSGARDAALAGLWNAVIHQGTRWQVSAHVVPFLVRLIDDPANPGRAELMTLLRDIGVGPRGDRDLPFDPGVAFGRHGSQHVTKEQEDAIVELVYHLEEEITDDWADIADACAEKWEADAYWAAATHVDVYIRWLVDADSDVGSQAAELLAWFKPTEPTIASLLGADRNDAVRASANLALAHLDVPGNAIANKMALLLQHDSLTIKLTAAVALAYRVGQNIPDRALEILIDAKESQTLPDFPPGWRQRAQRGYAALALQRLGLT
ncbi:hypothetical protein Rhe02_44840 [Rhizocola hellebori]|uniref:HEAT repeat domain-containing protein n=2 Tax=Rhizocola hellebori TaxID=1392758 RepID=A0A8J3VHM2_9ACTN|nr:hypothetical protein Rhe02_44840 [Rhizocola hellebori]